MLIQSTFDLQFELPARTPMVALLSLHPSLDARRQGTDTLLLEATALDGAKSMLSPELYLDSFGNRCARFAAPAGGLRLRGSSVVDAPEAVDAEPIHAAQTPVEQLPFETLQFLLASRYCEVDRFVPIAQELFAGAGSGWQLAATIRDWVHDKVTFDYKRARPSKTAMDVFTERAGVCRDFQHLAVTLTRCMNLPARYVTGYLGDIRVPAGGPGDFSAWYEVWLEGRWWTMDARHNTPRLGRILMATGRDAADVALTTSFGVANLTHFFVESKELTGDAQTAMPSPSLPVNEGEVQQR